MSAREQIGEAAARLADALGFDPQGAAAEEEIRPALEDAYEAGVEAGKAEASANLVAWESVVRAAVAWEADLDGTARDYALSRAILKMIAKTPQYQPKARPDAR